MAGVYLLVTVEDTNWIWKDGTHSKAGHIYGFRRCYMGLDEAKV